MSFELSIGHLTGSAKVTENYLNCDKVEWRNRRTVEQMFFQPYESKKEFIYCARHTLIPMTLIGLAILNPIIIIGVPTIIGSIALVCMATAGLSKLCDDEEATSFFLSAAEYLIKDLCQALIDIVVLPLSAIAMVTRGISTGLQAAGVGREEDKMDLSPCF